MLTILHTNDFHNHLTAEQADRLRLARDEIDGNGLLLDAGDAGGSGNVTFRPAGEPILEEMGRAGYDAMTVGNRDFHFSRTGFHAKLFRATFPVLCANVRRTGEMPGRPAPESGTDSADQGSEPRDPPTTGWIIRNAGGLRVAIFGVTVPMITERMLVRKVSAYVFDDPIQVAASLVPWLRETERPDLVIALTHIGLRRDRELAERVPGIDLIVGGHTHVVLEQGERVGETLLVQAGSFAHLLGRVVITNYDAGRFDAAASLEPL